MRKKQTLVDRPGVDGLSHPETSNQLSDMRRKRTDDQREQDLVFISKLMLRETLTRPEMAERLRQERAGKYIPSVYMINNDIKELHKRWRDAYLDDVDVLKGRELRRIDELESAYWASYERSLKGTSAFNDTTSELIDETQIGAVEPSGNEKREQEVAEKLEELEAKTRKKTRHTRTHRFTTDRDGDFRFLEGIQWCIDKRCEILGLNAPVKAEMTFDWRSEAEKEGIDPSLMFNDMVKRFVDNNEVDNSTVINGEAKELNDGNS